MADSCDNREPAEKDTVYGLYPIMRKNWQKDGFSQADKDLEMLCLAKDFPEKVPEIEKIAARFRSFIEKLPENEEALKSLDVILKQVRFSVKDEKNK